MQDVKILWTGSDERSWLQPFLWERKGQLFFHCLFFGGFRTKRLVSYTLEAFLLEVLEPGNEGLYPSFDMQFLLSRAEEEKVPVALRKRMQQQLALEAL